MLKQLLLKILRGLIVLLIPIFVSIIPIIIDKIQEKHPDTLIYSYPYITSEGPQRIFIQNFGQAIDRVKIDVHTGYVIESYSVSNDKVITLYDGGPGETYAIFTIDALWPDVPAQYIDIVTEGNLKVAATVKGWSDYEGDVEDVTPVTVIQVKPQYRWLSPQWRLIKPHAITEPY